MDQYPSYWMWTRRDLRGYPRSHSKPGESWDQEQAFAEDSSLALGGSVWPPRSYTCSFCRREFRSAQALGGHMNVHRRDRARLKQSSDNTVEDQAGSTDQYHHHQHAAQKQYPLFAEVGLEYPSQICTKNEVSDNNYKNKTLVSPAYTFGTSTIISGVQQEITHQRNLLSFMSSTREADSKHDHVEDSRPVVIRDDQLVYNQVQKSKSDCIESHCLVDSFRKRRQRSVSGDEVIEEEEDRDMHIRRRIDLSLSVSNFLSDHVHNSDKRSIGEQSLLCFLERSSDVGQHLQSELVAASQSQSSSENLDLELRLGGSRPKVN